jgi:hypothetical protein
VSQAAGTATRGNALVTAFEVCPKAGHRCESASLPVPWLTLP